MVLGLREHHLSPGFGSDEEGTTLKMCKPGWIQVMFFQAQEHAEWAMVFVNTLKCYIGIMR